MQDGRKWQERQGRRQVRGSGQVYIDTVEGPRSPARRTGPDAGRATVDRAIGLLAGRTRCRLSDAQRHLLRMAQEQERDLAEVAAGVIALLDIPDSDAALPPAFPPVPLPPAAGTRRPEPWTTTVQRILDVLPGAAALLSPVRDEDGRLVDLVFTAVSPEAVAPDGHHGAQLVGNRLSDYYSSTLTSDRWAVYARVLDHGEPAEVPHFHAFGGIYTVRAHRLGGGLVLSWVRHDEDARESDRVAGTERLGNLGWGEWDLVSGAVRWSDQLYRIYERDPALGPLPGPEADAMTLADDLPLRMAAEEAFERGEKADVTMRVRIAGRIKHLRTVADAVRDASGRPLRVFGIVQDITSQQTSAERLAEVERQLAQKRRDLDAEHAMAATLQEIILPIPDGPIELPGLKVALRYLPAGQESLVGGDWYHAATASDGSVLLAVGDVAGHGTQAATTMAQLRHALRALAVITTDPAVLLGHLNRLTCDLEHEAPELAATAVLARYDPARGRITWAQAGHPPPLLSRAGRTETLARPRGSMLGVVDHAVYETAVLDLAIGDVLLLYTDGLVEHRRRGPDHGLQTVVAAMDEAVRAAPERPLSELLDRLRQANPDDDTCILAVRPATGGTQDLRRHLRPR
jgi:serine phosphatase RsbU (regulator of sigma subunit)